MGLFGFVVVGGGRMFAMVSFCLFLGGAVFLGVVYILGAIHWMSWESTLGPSGFFFCSGFFSYFLSGGLVFPWRSRYLLLVPMYLAFSGEFLRHLSFLSFHFLTELEAFLAGGGR